MWKLTMLDSCTKMKMSRGSNSSKHITIKITSACSVISTRITIILRSQWPAWKTMVFRFNGQALKITKLLMILSTSHHQNLRTMIADTNQSHSVKVTCLMLRPMPKDKNADNQLTPNASNPLTSPMECWTFGASYLGFQPSVFVSLRTISTTTCA